MPNLPGIPPSITFPAEREILQADLDAFAYLRAMYEGRIAADDLENAYYKHGVRRWLAGDMWSAALSFARAARDNPEDRRVFASFADAAGRQHASPACVKALADARRGDRTTAFERYVRLWQRAAPDREKVFFARYAAASGPRAARKFPGDDSVSSDETRAEDSYLTRVLAAFQPDSRENPFSGALTQAQIIRMQR